MRSHRVFRAIAPVLAAGLSAAIAACNTAETAMSGDKGVPLAELDLTDGAPSAIAALGPDSVEVRSGETFAVEVDGSPEAAARMRFVYENGELGILRQRGEEDDGSIAVVTVTAPPPVRLTVGGSGQLVAAELAGDSELNVLGSGALTVGSVRADTLKVNVAGSGALTAAGTADRLELNIAGSGDADLAALKTPRANVRIAGSGGSTFASDGEVEANIVGSGEVVVRGRARCTIKAVGSGSLTCQPES